MLDSIPLTMDEVVQESTDGKKFKIHGLQSTIYNPVENGKIEGVAISGIVPS